ncbi:guanylate kinase [Rhodohalobacter sulfatireducens]|uniref:Guanylate kinase n=1 Tax=Rhodohalobacter sulfatireducens TaxID=2911366 RepID=A0ABS9KI55_9BACT|nr:guanylate kinase [Rhodohalobacter sulfatireducens]MCG2590540.1 guanylate kinase [Rhodohalobacter sulfatireducens]MDR9365823.1 guanylate kinase [Balneolaceae bacterium]
MSKKGKILVLVAPSGGGKTTMARRILDDFDQIRFSVSATTRPPRKGEKDGVNYHYISKEEFKEKIDNGDFLEWEEVYDGTLYGTLRKNVEKELEKGYFILLDIDVLGALNVKKIFEKDALAIFIQPPSIEILKERLQKRATDAQQDIQTRLERAKKEMAYANRFDHIIINDDLEKAYSQIKELVTNFIKQT